MSGWLNIKSEHTFYYKPSKKGENEEWPPKYWKFHLETKGEPKVEAAYVDLRRFGRIRLVDCPGGEIRKNSPLVENGPDPVQDKDVVTVDWLAEKCKKKHVPIKALLLDQANVSGIGNWVGDEIMYDAKMHPEQYSDSLSDQQIKQLHKSIHYVCSTAVDLLADSEQFPDTWLFKHRWGKGKKDAPNTLPNGEKIVFLTVGGRTSAVVPSVQKKTGPVAKEIEEAESGGEGAPAKTKKTPSKKRKAEEAAGAPEHEGTNVVKEGSLVNGSAKKPTTKKSRKSKFKEELGEEEEAVPPPAKRGKSNDEVKNEAAKAMSKAEAVDGMQEQTGSSTKRKKNVKEPVKDSRAAGGPVVRAGSLPD